MAQDVTDNLAAKPQHEHCITKESGKERKKREGGGNESARALTRNAAAESCVRVRPIVVAVTFGKTGGNERRRSSIHMIYNTATVRRAESHTRVSLESAITLDPSRGKIKIPIQRLAVTVAPSGIGKSVTLTTAYFLYYKRSIGDCQNCHCK